MRLSSSLAALIGADNAATGGPCTASTQKPAGLITFFAGIVSATGASSPSTTALIECVPSARVFAADGIHRNFGGVAIMASHLHRTLLRNFARRQSTWLQHAASAPSLQVQGQAPPPPPPPPTAAALACEAP
ncbi:hypothetical protein HPB48_015718 [Haemaphysalis longicornis]|uniref:Uncharacterized protein n=1 Tax=Haemaphysalis longicornis TaxID=44386 RepID=A0A9J6GFH1_HAELO|nr:hypothetical protein HPB48_015718 [Haemaphysalis longicornis]